MAAAIESHLVARLSSDSSWLLNLWSRIRFRSRWVPSQAAISDISSRAHPYRPLTSLSLPSPSLLLLRKGAVRIVPPRQAQALELVHLPVLALMTCSTRGKMKGSQMRCNDHEGRTTATHAPSSS